MIVPEIFDYTYSSIPLGCRSRAAGSFAECSHL
jgi:hypothetical protein